MKLLIHAGLHLLDGPEDLSTRQLSVLSAACRDNHSADINDERSENGDCH